MSAHDPISSRRLLLSHIRTPYGVDKIKFPLPFSTVLRKPLPHCTVPTSALGFGPCIHFAPYPKSLIEKQDTPDTVSPVRATSTNRSS